MKCVKVPLREINNTRIKLMSDGLMSMEYRIKTTDEYGYIHEKIVEANTGTNEKNIFFHNDVKYELFKPLVKFMKSTHGNNEIKDGMKKISFEIFRVEE